jgi:hypothetical protein
LLLEEGKALGAAVMDVKMVFAFYEYALESLRAALPNFSLLTWTETVAAYRAHRDLWQPELVKRNWPIVFESRQLFEEPERGVLQVGRAWLNRGQGFKEDSLEHRIMEPEQAIESAGRLSPNTVLLALTGLDEQHLKPGSGLREQSLFFGVQSMHRTPTHDCSALASAEGTYFTLPVSELRGPRAHELFKDVILYSYHELVTALTREGVALWGRFLEKHTSPQELLDCLRESPAEAAEWTAIPVDNEAKYPFEEDTIVLVVTEERIRFSLCNPAQMHFLRNMLPGTFIAAERVKWGLTLVTIARLALWAFTQQ